MTISSETNKVTYSGNGSTTVFAYTFEILANTDLLVQSVNNTTGVITTYTLTTDYTVSNVGVSTGGNVTFGSAPPSGCTVVLQRNVPATQPTNFSEYDAFSSATLNQALDRLTMLIQQLETATNAAIQVGPSVTIPTTVTGLPSALNTIRVNSGGTAFEFVAMSSVGGYVFPGGSTGFLSQINNSTAVARTITGTANHITVTNGDGVSGNPTVDIASNYPGQSTISTVGTIGTGVWNGTPIANEYLANTTITVNGTAIALGASGTVTAAAGTLTGTTLNSTVVTSSLTAVGIIDTGVWQGTAIANTYLANSSITVNGTDISLGGSGTVTAAAGTLTGTTLNSTVVTGSIQTFKGANGQTAFTASDVASVADYINLYSGPNNNAGWQIVSTQTNASGSLTAKGTGGWVIGSIGASCTTPLALQAGTYNQSHSMTLTANRTITWADGNTTIPSGTLLSSGGGLGTPASGTLTNCTGYTDANLSTSDVTTNNVSISKHGFAPKAPNDSTKYLDGTGAYSVPVGTSQVVQRVSTQTGAVATGTTVIPFDDTIPQNTEGDQYMSLSITPTSSSHILKIEVAAQVASSLAGTNELAVALFQDSTAGALAAAVQGINSAGAMLPVKLIHTMTAGTTSSTTFKVRCGPGAAATLTFNGSAGGRIFGGILASSITITEYIS